MLSPSLSIGWVTFTPNLYVSSKYSQGLGFIYPYPPNLGAKDYTLAPYFSNIFFLRHSRQLSVSPLGFSLGARLTGLKSLSWGAFSCKFCSFSRLFNCLMEQALPVSTPYLLSEHANVIGLIPIRVITASVLKIFFMTFTLSFNTFKRYVIKHTYHYDKALSG